MFVCLSVCAYTRRQRDRCSSRKQGDASQRCPPTEVTSVSAVQRLHDADHKARRNATLRRKSNNSPARSKQSRCPLCQQLYQLYKKGPRC